MKNNYLSRPERRVYLPPVITRSVLALEHVVCASGDFTNSTEVWDEEDLSTL